MSQLPDSAARKFPRATHSGLEYVRLHFPSCRSRDLHYDRISVSSPRPLFWSSFVSAGLLKRSLTKIEVEDWRPIFDHNGGLWIGSWGNGVLHIPAPNELPVGTFSRLSPGAETFTETEGLSDNHATA